jgi:hypothetical protein
MQIPEISIPNAIVRLKSEYIKTASGRTYLSEVLPLEFSKELPIESSILLSLHRFAGANEMYVDYSDQEIASVRCRVYEADINRYWLSSKKYDTCYQPFYPTWLLSAYALASTAKSMGFTDLVDIGSGDGRIAYCGRLVGLKSFGIEIDAGLVELQKAISNATGVSYPAFEADATRYDYSRLGLGRPIFFISGLPEMGEMLAKSVLEKILADPELKTRAGFNFMGSHAPKSLSRDHTGWGWGELIRVFNLEVSKVATLPTYWTTEEPIDTAYVYAIPR